jgi:hypothetical protein
VLNTELTVGQLRRILRTAPDDATIAEGLEELANAERCEAADMAHGVRLTAYNEYIAHRRERERDTSSRPPTTLNRPRLLLAPISRDRAYMVYKEAADLERLRFEIREPRLEFQEWIDAGKPAVHQIRGVRDLQARRLEAGATS